MKTFSLLPPPPRFSRFCELPKDSGNIVRLDVRGDYLFVECDSGKKYRIDSTGKEILLVNLRIVK